MSTILSKQIEGDLLDLKDYDVSKLEAPGVFVLKLRAETLGQTYAIFVSKCDVHSCLAINYLRGNFSTTLNRENFISAVIDTMLSKIAAAIGPETTIIVVHTRDFGEPFEYRGPADTIAIAYQQIADSQYPRPSFRGAIPCFQKFGNAMTPFARGSIYSSKSTWKWYARPDSVRRFMLSILYDGEAHFFYRNCCHARESMCPKELGGSVFEVYIEEGGTVVITDVIRYKGEPRHMDTANKRDELLSTIPLPEGFRIAVKQTDSTKLFRYMPKTGALVFYDSEQTLGSRMYCWKTRKVLQHGEALLYVDWSQNVYAAPSAIPDFIVGNTKNLRTSPVHSMVYLCRWDPCDQKWCLVRPGRNSERGSTTEYATAKRIKAGVSVHPDPTVDYELLCKAIYSKQQQQPL